MPSESDPKPGPASATSRGRGMRFLQSVDASLLGLGTQMLSEVAAGVLLGLAADYMLGTKNRWVVVGSIAGVIVSMWTVVRVAMRLQTTRRQPPKRADREGESGGPI